MRKFGVRIPTGASAFLQGTGGARPACCPGRWRASHYPSHDRRRCRPTVSGGCWAGAGEGWSMSISENTAPVPRRRKGTGTQREIRPGVWEVRVPGGPDPTSGHAGTDRWRFMAAASRPPRPGPSSLPRSRPLVLRRATDRWTRGGAGASTAAPRVGVLTAPKAGRGWAGCQVGPWLLTGDPTHRQPVQASTLGHRFDDIRDAAGLPEASPTPVKRRHPAGRSAFEGRHFWVPCATEVHVVGGRPGVWSGPTTSGWPAQSGCVAWSSASTTPSSHVGRRHSDTRTSRTIQTVSSVSSTTPPGKRVADAGLDLLTPPIDQLQSRGHAEGAFHPIRVGKAV